MDRLVKGLVGGAVAGIMLSYLTLNVLQLSLMLSYSNCAALGAPIEAARCLNAVRNRAATYSITTFMLADIIFKTIKGAPNE